MATGPMQQQTERTRRDFLTSSASGVGAVALSSLLADDLPGASMSRDINPLAPQAPHFAPKAKQCIFFFFAGGSSQLDLFDPKPKVNELHGKHAPESLLEGERFAFIQKDSAVLLGSEFEFAKHGESGMEFSNLLPNIATCADDIAMIRSMHTEPFNHHPAQTMMNAGFPRMGRPTVGSWLNYGLGNPSQNLPGYVVLRPKPGARGGASNWSSGFMPTSYEGVEFNIKGEPIRHLGLPKGMSREAHRRSLDALKEMNRRQFGRYRDPKIESRIAQYELAFRMQSAAPELIDLSEESQGTQEAYGLDRENSLQHDFSKSCLLARRLVERGVRFVNIYMAGWDHHTGVVGGLKRNCKAVDQPIAALLKDLKQRGMLDETLVVWGTEFGRTSLGDNRQGRGLVNGRDHQPSAYSLWMAGGGVQGGTTYGSTDELGWNVTENGVHTHDFHATLLHLFGIDHKALTYHFEGRDYRLTDVGGQVKHDLIA